MTDESAEPLAQWNLLTGEAEEVYSTALERYGVWPTTVWEVDYTDATTQELKRLIGDLSDYHSATRRNKGGVAGGLKHMTRKGLGPSRANLQRLQATGASSVYGKKGSVTHVSVFNPAVAGWMLNLYAPAAPATVYDPFAGGGTRAIMSAHKGLHYIGCELRQEEVEAVRERCRGAKVPEGSVTIHHCDAREALEHVEPASASFLLTCPPYYDLEMYDGGTRDLSMASSYREFLEGLSEVIRVSRRVLIPGSYSCWVVGLHRDQRTGELLPLHHAVALLHRAHGFHHKEEVVLVLKNTGAIQRVGNFEKGDRRLVRVHEYLQVFVCK